MSSGVAVYPSTPAVPIGNVIKSTMENVGFSIYSSDEDEEDEYVKNKDVAESPSKIIAEAESLLLSQSLSEDESVDFRRSPTYRSTTKGVKDEREENENVKNGCLAYSTSHKKVKKFVTFNMELNETHEYVSDDEQTTLLEGEDDNTWNEQVIDAGELFDSSDSDDEDDRRGAILADGARSAFGSDDILAEKDEEDVSSEQAIDAIQPRTPQELVKDDVASLHQEKLRLEEEIKLLHQEYRTEMQRMRDEYESRREDYLTELDEFKRTLDKERHQHEDESMNNLEEKAQIKDRKDKIEEEKIRLVELEEELQKRRQQCTEQDQEIEEYERYLNRRHTSLNDKEEDLKILQEELEELSRVLRKREKELRHRQDRIDAAEEEVNVKRLSPLEEEELTQLQAKVKDLTNELLQCKHNMEKSDEQSRQLQQKTQTLEAENKKLLQKIKHLETQLTVEIKLHEPKPESHYIRRTSVMLAQQSSTENGDLVSSSRVLEYPPTERSLQSKSTSLYSQKSNQKQRDNGANTRVDSRTNVSKTCIIM